MSQIDNTIVASLVKCGYSDWAEYYAELVEAQAYWSGSSYEDDEE